MFSIVKRKSSSKPPAGKLQKPPNSHSRSSNPNEVQSISPKDLPTSLPLHAGRHKSLLPHTSKRRASQPNTTITNNTLSQTTSIAQTLPGGRLHSRSPSVSSLHPPSQVVQSIRSSQSTPAQPPPLTGSSLPSYHRASSRSLSHFEPLPSFLPNQESSPLRRSSTMTSSRSHNSLIPPLVSESIPHQPTPPPVPPLPNPANFAHIPTGLLSSDPITSSLYISPSRPGLRKSRQNPSLNIILAGARDTGKSAFLSTFLGSFGASPDPPLDKLEYVGPTMLSSNTTSISEHPVGMVTGLTGERISLTVIDTPGLEIQSADESKVEYQVNEIIRYLEEKFEHSLQLERQVKREPNRLGDNHVHCCLYFLHPAILEPAHRACANASPMEATPINQMARMSIASRDLRAMKRISKRCNVLPVIGRADELTVKQLEDVRSWIRTHMRHQAIDLGVLTGTQEPDSEAEDEPETVVTSSSASSRSSEDEPAPKPRRKSIGAALSVNRRSHLTLTQHQADEELQALLPLSLISAEDVAPLAPEAVQSLNRTNPLRGTGFLQSEACSLTYARRFRWATVNVLDPNHCEFMLLRAVLLGTHLTRLKDSTRLGKYESYRTERLMKRERMTKLMGSEEQARLMKEMAKMEIPSVVDQLKALKDVPAIVQRQPNRRPPPPTSMTKEPVTKQPVNTVPADEGPIVR